jgi:hypothetical protein
VWRQATACGAAGASVLPRSDALIGRPVQASRVAFLRPACDTRHSGAGHTVTNLNANCGSQSRFLNLATTIVDSRGTMPVGSSCHHRAKWRARMPRAAAHTEKFAREHPAPRERGAAARGRAHAPTLPAGGSYKVSITPHTVWGMHAAHRTRPLLLPCLAKSARGRHRAPRPSSNHCRWRLPPSAETPAGYASTS